MRSILFSVSLIVLASTQVAAHCKISNAVGDAGGKAVAFGISAKKADSNALSDVTIFSKNNKFGVTQAGGAINPAKDIAAVQAISGKTLPQVTAGGQLKMTLHQVNADGAGPMTCNIDTTATGKFSKLNVVTNVPGNNGRSGASNKDFPLVVQLPKDVSCTGKFGDVSNACLVQCQNPAGPFGGVVPIQIASGKAKAAEGKADDKGKAEGDAKKDGDSKMVGKKAGGRMVRKRF